MVSFSKTKLVLGIIAVLALGCCYTSAFAYHPNDSLELEGAPNPILPIPSDTVLLQGYIPQLYPDLVKDRLACIQGGIQMTFHDDVYKWIKYYTVRDRAYTQRILERSSFYFPIFEEALKRHNMPDELKYLSIVESALIPKAQSWAAAVGLWQFIPSTGKAYGLEQDWFIDERMDIYKSTDAACRYLKFLYKYHGDWQLALAAYNCGPGRVNWAVQKAGGKGANFWTIYKFLPQETRGYVPAFIAACYTMNYAKDHFIYPQTPQTFIPSDTILVSQFLNIQEFAKQIDVSQEHMELLNPHLKKNAIPAYKKNYPLRFPAEKKEYVQTNRSAILRACASASRREIDYTAGKQIHVTSIEGRSKIYHKVEYGQSLAYIALKYNVSVANLCVWNRLTNHMIHPNQQLEVWIPSSQNTEAAPALTQEPKKENISVEKIESVGQLKNTNDSKDKTPEDK